MVYFSLLNCNWITKSHNMCRKRRYRNSSCFCFCFPLQCSSIDFSGLKEKGKSLRIFDNRKLFRLWGVKKSMRKTMWMNEYTVAMTVREIGSKRNNVWSVHTVLDHHYINLLPHNRMWQMDAIDPSAWWT